MQLVTSRFGGIEIDPEQVITLTQPIIGFQEYRRYVKLPGPEGSRLVWIQSIDAGELAFLLMDPRQVYGGYELHLGAHELAELAVRSVDELEVYTLLVVPSDPAKIRTNLKAPVLLNLKHRLGKQTILETSDYPIQFYLAQAGTPEAGEKETSDARSDT